MYLIVGLIVFMNVIKDLKWESAQEKEENVINETFSKVDQVEEC